MSAFYHETVQEVNHLTDHTFTFKTTRDPSMRFKNGHFTMVGLMVDGKPLARAYSIASPNHQSTLEFLSIKVPNGPLTSRLQKIKVGDQVLIGKKPTGTLVLDYLTPAKNLYLLATGTGLAPFMAVIKDPDTYERYERVILIHGVRRLPELAYREQILTLRNDEFLGEAANLQLDYFPCTTREKSRNFGRLTELLESGAVAEDLALPPLNPHSDRAMLCGSPAMLSDMKSILEKRGFKEGNTSIPGDYVVERAFVSPS